MSYEKTNIIESLALGPLNVNLVRSVQTTHVTTTS